jgi:ribonuclease HI
MAESKTFSVDDLEKLLDSNNGNNGDREVEIEDDMLADSVIKSFSVILFTDGSCIGKRQGTKFGGSGIYIHSTNNNKKYSKYNSINIFEKLPQEKILYNKNDSSIILYSGDTNRVDFKYRCCEENCNKIAYSYKYKQDIGNRNISEKDIVCSDHKSESSIIFSKYTLFHPTNIRSEGNAILIALRTIKFMIEGKNNKNKRCDLEKYLSSQVSNYLNNFDYNEIFTADIESENKEYDEFLIVSDSKFWIDLITIWLKGWVTKRSIMERKNSDIILEILDVHNWIILNKATVKFKHIKGHQDSKKENGKSIELNFYHKGNILADKLATHASQSKDNKITVIL